jgi:hypothetical protein
LASRAVVPGVYAERAEIIDLAATLAFMTGVVPPALSEGRVCWARSSGRRVPSADETRFTAPAVRVSCPYATAGGPMNAKTSDPDLLFQRVYDDGEIRIQVGIDAAYNTTAILSGRGTVKGAKALTDILDEAADKLGRHNRTSSLVSLERLYDSPIRGQLILGKWLYQNRQLVKIISVYGGKPWEMKMARAVMQIAQINNAGFFQTEAEAKRFLGRE